MAEPLKHSFGADVPRTIARMITAVYPRFDRKAFVRSVLDGYDELELMPRGRKIAQELRRFMPEDYEQAIEILLASLDQTPERTVAHGMGVTAVEDPMAATMPIQVRAVRVMAVPSAVQGP